MENRLSLEIGSMSCEHCVRAVRDALGSVPGVRIEQVEIGSARLSYDSEQADVDRITGAVEEEGYPVRGVGREK